MKYWLILKDYRAFTKDGYFDYQYVKNELVTEKEAKKHACNMNKIAILMDIKKSCVHFSFGVRLLNLYDKRYTNIEQYYLLNYGVQFYKQREKR